MIRYFFLLFETFFFLFSAVNCSYQQQIIMWKQENVYYLYERRNDSLILGMITFGYECKRKIVNANFLRDLTIFIVIVTFPLTRTPCLLCQETVNIENQHWFVKNQTFCKHTATFGTRFVYSINTTPYYGYGR